MTRQQVPVQQAARGAPSRGLLRRRGQSGHGKVIEGEQGIKEAAGNEEEVEEHESEPGT